MDAYAYTEPARKLPAPSVAELPTTKYTLRASVPLTSTTDEFVAVTNDVALTITNVDDVLPPPSSVREPVRKMDDADAYVPGDST